MKLETVQQATQQSSTPELQLSEAKSDQSTDHIQSQEKTDSNKTINRSKRKRIIARVFVYIPAFCALVSVLALCLQQQSLSLSNIDFRGERSIIWLGNSLDSQGDFQLKPASDSMNMQTAVVLFPRQSGISERHVFPPDYSIKGVANTTVMPPAKTWVTEKTANSPAILWTQAPISQERDLFMPIVIESVYTAKGDSFQDRSLYDIRYKHLTRWNGSKLVTLTFTGLIFRRRLNPWENSLETCSKEWSSDDQKTFGESVAQYDSK